MIDTKIKLTYAILVSISMALIASLIIQDWTAVFACVTGFLGWLQVLLYEKAELKRFENNEPYDPMKSPTTI